MPLYEYKHKVPSASCPEYFEHYSRRMGRHLRKCPMCRRAVVHVMRPSLPVILNKSDTDKALPRNPDGTPYRFKETGYRNRKREAERVLEAKLLKERPDNPFGLKVEAIET